MESEKVPQMKDAKWVGQRLGFSRQAITRKARLGEIPAVRLGTFWRFDEKCIEAYIEAQTTGQIATQ